MKWEKLLSLRRFGDKDRGIVRHRKEQDQERLGFDIDYDRIVFSEPFRSLQDKTQVIPLSGNTFVHTRLTHSLEVSVVGRSLGRRVGKALLEKYPHLKEMGYQFGDWGAIVASAAMAHDIGNPPFGHSGEKAIGNFFQNLEGSQIREFVTEKQYQDLCKFEGNANGFRILTQGKDENTAGGLRLTYATLGAFLKYPKEVLPERPTSFVEDKKYSFFQSEKQFALSLIDDLGLSNRSTAEGVRYSRHPLSFLVEAADDICYTIIDFEDGINLGFIPEEKALEYLSHLTQKMDTHKYSHLKTREDRIGYLRALSINTLIDSVCEVFLNNETDILQGNFHKSLLQSTSYASQIREILKISAERIYHSREVVEKEIAGYEVISTIIGRYYQAMMNLHNNTLTHHDTLLLKTLPRYYRKENTSVYEKILGVCSFVASLTDGKAVELHSKMKGIW